MKLRYLVLLTLVAASVAACTASPTASAPTRSPSQVLLAEGDSLDRGTGAAGSGH